MWFPLYSKHFVPLLWCLCSTALQRCFSNSREHHSHLENVWKYRLLGPTPRDSALEGLGWDLRICISNYISGDADAVGLRTTHWGLLSSYGDSFSHHIVNFLTIWLTLILVFSEALSTQQILKYLFKWNWIEQEAKFLLLKLALTLWNYVPLLASIIQKEHI